MSEIHQRFLDQLLRTQWLAPERLASYERRLKADLVLHAAAQVPFYRDSGRLAPLLRAGAIDLSRWNEVPVLTRQEARDRPERLHAAHVPPQAGIAHVARTSGSTGSPFVFQRSAATSVASVCCTERHMIWHGLERTRDIAEITVAQGRDPNDPATQVNPRSLFGPAGERHHLRPGTPGIDQHDWLRGTAAPYLRTYPSNARAMARDILAGRKPPLRLDAVVCFGELLADDARQEIRDGLADRVIDRYAAEETGILAAECEAGALHVQCEMNAIEILDDAGQPVPAGEDGHVVITTLYNYAMPLIRYAIGDIAALSPEPCRCGRTLPVLTRVRGRVRDLFHFSDGRRIWPYVPFFELNAFLPLRQLQIVQTDRSHVELRYVPEPGRAPDFEAAANFVRGKLAPDIAVSFTSVDEIPRLPGGKYRDYVSLVDACAAPAT